jgi:hypothetical protein
VKYTKDEHDRFWAALGPCFYLEESDETPDPDDVKMAPDTVVTVTCGTICYQKPLSGEEPREVKGILSAGLVREMKDGDGADLLLAFKRWRQSQDAVQVILEGPKDALPKLLAAIAAAGFKVLK